MSIQIKGSPQQSTPGLTPELCQLINADVDVRRAASLDNVCDSSDIDTGDQLQVPPTCRPKVCEPTFVTTGELSAHRKSSTSDWACCNRPNIPMHELATSRSIQKAALLDPAA